jgi:hypothetical protein
MKFAPQTRLDARYEENARQDERQIYTRETRQIIKKIKRKIIIIIKIIFANNLGELDN